MCKQVYTIQYFIAYLLLTSKSARKNVEAAIFYKLSKAHITYITVGLYSLICQLFLADSHSESDQQTKQTVTYIMGQFYTEPARLYPSSLVCSCVDSVHSAL